MHLVDETRQIFLLPDSNLRIGVHVLVRMRCGRLLESFDMLRALHQVDPRPYRLQLLLAQYQGKSTNPPHRNCQRIHYSRNILRIIVRLQGYAC